MCRLVIGLGLEIDRNSFTFSFSAPKLTIYGSFGHFRFQPKLFSVSFSAANLPENTEIQMRSVELQNDLHY